MISICAVQRQGPSEVRLMTTYASLARISETCEMFGQLHRVTRLDVDPYTHGFEVTFSAREAADQFIDRYSKNCSLSQETISVETTNEIQPPQPEPPIVPNQPVTGTTSQPIRMKLLKRGDEDPRKVMILIPRNTNFKEVREYLMNRYGGIEYANLVRQPRAHRATRLDYAFICFYNAEVAARVLANERDSDLAALTAKPCKEENYARKLWCNECRHWISASPECTKSHPEICRYQIQNPPRQRPFGPNQIEAPSGKKTDQTSNGILSIPVPLDLRKLESRPGSAIPAPETMASPADALILWDSHPDESMGLQPPLIPSVEK